MGGQIEQIVYSRYLDAQNLWRFINSQTYIQAVKIMSEEDLIVLEKYAKEHNLSKIKNLCKTTLLESVEDLTVDDLRKIAKRLFIPYYSSYSKEQLTSLILAKGAVR